MNQAASVTSVKAMSDEDRAKHFKAIDTSPESNRSPSAAASAKGLKALYDNLDDEDDSDVAGDPCAAGER